MLMNSSVTAMARVAFRKFHSKTQEVIGSNPEKGMTFQMTDST